ncbi:MAG: deoxyribodipyrimidine photo-lyase [Halobacteriovoraceae bacterium]|nr:deoxyribodipyrimidine photo-lyase [Halobacteriovoraceae bacterium]
MKQKYTIFWFRRDLRIEDNIGLHYALKSEFPVVPVFIFDKHILEKLHSKKDLRVQFIHDTLLVLKKDLNMLGSDLIVFHDSPIDAWKKILEKYNVTNVFTNEDYEPDAIKRDNEIEQLLGKMDVVFHSFKDQCIFAKDEILKKNGTPYTVYTPYKNKWYELLTPKAIASIINRPLFKNFAQLSSTSFPSLNSIGFEKCEPFDLVKSIKTKIIKEYDLKRDLPALNATSHLSLHLRFGTVSVRKCAQVGLEINKTWLNELIWREFFMQILFHYPNVVKGPFKEKYSNIQWINDKSQFKKWREGKTGYPLVDAGMRELNQTGFMHNRVRMLTASFLVKHLLIDWRWGEKYFAEKLLDFDLSANNGNWQWVAGTGCDAAPYFRIFNPEIQLKKFDKNFDYVKKWIPEFGTSKYPEKMIDHQYAYQRALLAYKEALNG